MLKVLEAAAEAGKPVVEGRDQDEEACCYHDFKPTDQADDRIADR